MEETPGNASRLVSCFALIVAVAAFVNWFLISGNMITITLFSSFTGSAEVCVMKIK